MSYSPVRARDRFVLLRGPRRYCPPYSPALCVVSLMASSLSGGPSASRSRPSCRHRRLRNASQTSAASHSHQHQAEAGFPGRGQPGGISGRGAYSVLERDPGATPAYGEHAGKIAAMSLKCFPFQSLPPCYFQVLEMIQAF